MATPRRIQASESLARLHRSLQLLAPELTLEILALLGEGAMDTGTIARGLDRDVTQVSRQLQALLAEGFIECRRSERHHVYRLTERVRFQATPSALQLSLSTAAGTIVLVCPIALLGEAKISAARGYELLADHPVAPLEPADTVTPSAANP